MSTSATVASHTIGRPELARYFAEICVRMDAAESPSAEAFSVSPLNMSELKPFLSEVSRRIEEAKEWKRRNDKKHATDFNVFDLIAPDENKLSDILAMLLDPKGDHGQGDLFLRLLFEQMGANVRLQSNRSPNVQREAPTHGIAKYRRRIDILIDAGIRLAIENKVDALEQPEQVADYLEHLQTVSRRGSEPYALIYLTPEGRPPESLARATIDELKRSGILYCWSYQDDIRSWLGTCQEECEATRICDFLSNFIRYIEMDLKRETTRSPNEDPNDE